MDNVFQLGPSANPRTTGKRDLPLEHFPVDEFIRQRSTNPETTRVYKRALDSFLRSPQITGLRIYDLQPDHVFNYCKELEGSASASTVRQALAAIRGFLQWAVEQNLIRENPAVDVRGPRHSLHNPNPADCLSFDDKLKLINGIELTTAVDFRDQAILGILVYSLCSIEAAIAMHGSDFYWRANRWWFRLQEKNRTTIRHIAAHPVASRYVSMYVALSPTSLEDRSPLFRRISRDGPVSDQPLTRTDALSIIRRRAKEAGLPSAACCEAFSEVPERAYPGTLLVRPGEQIADRIA